MAKAYVGSIPTAGEEVKMARKLIFDISVGRCKIDSDIEVEIDGQWRPLLIQEPGGGTIRPMRTEDFGLFRFSGDYSDLMKEIQTGYLRAIKENEHPVNLF